MIARTHLALFNPLLLCLCVCVCERVYATIIITSNLIRCKCCAAVAPAPCCLPSCVL